MDTLKNLKTILLEHNEKIKQLKTEMTSEVKEKLKLIFNEIFLSFPQIENLNWAQYTPYFNDGDPCEFRFSGLNVKLKPEYVKNREAYESEEQGFDLTDLEHYAHSLPLNLIETLEGLNSTLYLSEDLLEDIFGDHAEVIVTPEKLEVLDYSHD